MTNKPAILDEEVVAQASKHILEQKLREYIDLAERRILDED